MLSLPAALVALAVASGGGGDTVLLDFYGDYCGPCRSMIPTVEQLTARGYPVRRVNVSQYPDVARRFGVATIPCFVMIVNGREAGRVVGTTSLAGLEQLCSRGLAASNPNRLLAMPARAAPFSQQAGPPRQDAAPAFNQAPAFSLQPAAQASAFPRAAVVPVSLSTASQPVSDETLLAASVRIRVEDPQGSSCGSGTIIDARIGGEALVLTCGHLFRDSQGTGKIEIDVFGAAPSTRVPGRLIGYDLERDVGLVAFKPQGPVMVARVAPPSYSLRAGDAVTSIGCNLGADPTVQHSRINSLDRVGSPGATREGLADGPHAPWHMQVAGQPVIGRSGGGLFSSDGMVIGVCNAAGPGSEEGFYAALGSIHSALDQRGLSSLYKQNIAPPAMVPPDSAATTLAAVDPFAARKAGPRSGDSEGTALAATAHSATADRAATAADEQAFMEQIRRRVREGSEVVCIVRDRNNPQAKNEIITLDRAWPSGAEQAANDARSRNIPHETSMEVSKRPTPILEWDAETGWKHRQPMP